MDPMIIAAIAELAKMAVISVTSYMKQAGLTEAQIEDVFQKAKAGMMVRDPANIPN